MVNADRGFTLIEILVVVIVVGILMGVVVGSFTSTDREQQLRGYVERLALKIEMARDKALQRNREWGMYVGDEGVSFAEFDEANGEWIPYEQRPFKPDPYARSLEFKATVEAYEGLPSDDAQPGEERELPDIILFSSGETTPFALTLKPKDWDTLWWQLETDGFTRISVEREQG